MGGLVAGTLWTTLKVGFAYYVSHMANYTRTYGALATVVVFLLWINLSACLLLWGAELAAVAGGRRRLSRREVFSGRGVIASADGSRRRFHRDAPCRAPLAPFVR